ncbi:MAG: NAD(P)H-hydrate dehydratase [Candidatus Ratteibacteria bacterium]|nr:NAD(P)H-hydrate dehydratase [Candidatus Ratteibacteria bacterium]
MKLPPEMRKLLPPRPREAHKGTTGHVFILAGSLGLTGAAVLSALGALRSGAGLVTLGIPKSLNVIVAVKLTEAMTLPLPETSGQTLSLKAEREILNFSKRINVVALGPGLSQNKATVNLIKQLIKKINVPLVIDADGINALSGEPEILLQRKAATIITPHPGEMSRLIGFSVKKIQANRRQIARKVASQFKIVVILKGRNTVIATPKGETFINPTGGAGMASGGMGDVLTGIVASFLAQGLLPLAASKLAVYAHGLAADWLVKKKGLRGIIASDVVDKLPFVLKNN